MKLLTRLLTSTIPVLMATTAFAQPDYVTLRFGTGDFSSLTPEDMEIPKELISSNETTSGLFGISLGWETQNNGAIEFGISSFADHSLGISIEDGSAIRTSRRNSLDITHIQSFGDSSKFRPFVRLGLSLGVTDTTIDKENLEGIASNPVDESRRTVQIDPMFGIGVTSRLSKRLDLGIEYVVISGAMTDYINNIDAGYISRDITSIQAKLKYHFQDSDSSVKADPTGWSVGIFGGRSKTDAKLTGGEYDGEIRDLGTDLPYANVSGQMSDDSTASASRISFAKSFGAFEFEGSIADFGYFASRSSVDGVTGEGNALTASTSRQVHFVGVSLGYSLPMNSSKLRVTPSIGVGMVRVQDEIYNNLYFSGVGGSDQESTVIESEIGFSVGLKAGYAITDHLELQARYDLITNAGNSGTLGEGNAQSLLLGTVVKF